MAIYRNKRADAEDGRKTGDGNSVGFFIPLPKELAGQFPDLGSEDQSDAHTTFLYVGKVPKERQAEFKTIAARVLESIRGPVRAYLHGPDYFEHPDKARRVAIMRVRFSHDMAGLRWKLRDALTDAGFQVDDYFPLVYSPHVTLGYLDGLDSEFTSKIPEGSWDFNGIEIWGLPKLGTVEFGNPTRVASRVVDAMRHQVSVELMKFLSNTARRLGVAEHVYVVGGAVRNFVIQEPIKDIDVVIDSVALNGKDSEWFAKQLQRAIPVPTNLTTNNYGVAILTIKGDWEVAGQNLNGEVIEIANARTESYDGGYKPDAVAPASIKDDTYRREFTFNTLLWRMLDLAEGPDKAEIIDLTGCGLRDLQQGVMRCPSDPDQTFSDDPSRMIRAIKFLIKYGFRISPDVEASIKRNREKLRNVPPGHLSNMIITLFYETGVGKRALLEMDKLGLLDVVKSIAQTDRPFREALANWAERKAELAFLFDLMDLGMPVGKSLNFLTPAQKDRVREITVQMDQAEGATFVTVLEQPGKVIDMPKLINEFGLRGQQIRTLTDTARSTLLDDPVLAAADHRWEALIRDSFARMGKVAVKASKTAAVVEVPHNFHPVKLDPPKGKSFQGFIQFPGIEIDVEHKSGSTRKGVSPTGQEWECLMHCHYGEIRGTEGVDGDKLDVYVGPNADSSLVVVIHQCKPDTGAYDEDKVMLGFDSPEEAIGAYKKQYNRPGFYRDGQHTVMPLAQFWRWVKDDRNQGKRIKAASDRSLAVRVANRYLEAGVRDWIKWIVQPVEVLVKHHKEFVQGPVDDAVDAVIRDLAPILVKHLTKREVESDVNEFVRGALAGQQGVPFPPSESTDFRSGYAWGRAHPEEIQGGDIPAWLKKQVIRESVKDFQGRITENVLAAGLTKVWHAISPATTFKMIRQAVKKHGWKMGVAIAFVEVFEHFILPGALALLFNNPKFLILAELPLGEIAYAVVFRFLGNLPKEVEDADEQGHLDWYESKFGPVRVAKTFNLNVGDPILYGKYKNKRGLIKDFGTSEKGDPTVIIEPVPKGLKHDKEITLFKIREDKSAVPEDLAGYTVLAKTAGWWAIDPHDASGGMIPPPVDKGGLMNAIPGVDPWDTVFYNGDEPADILGAAVNKVVDAYLESWGRAATPTELDAAWNFVMGPIRDQYDPKSLGTGTVKPNEAAYAAGGEGVYPPASKVTPWLPEVGEVVTAVEEGTGWAYLHFDSDREVGVPTDSRRSQGWKAASRVAARYQDKKEVKTRDGDTVTVYEYSERQVQNRHREKAERIDKLRGKIDKIRSQYLKDLKSDDEKVRYTALAVGLMDVTYERVGNDESAKEGHFGVTGWRKKHITFSGGKATIKYVGKSGVDHEKVVDDSALVKALKDATKGKGDDDPLCQGEDCRISAEDVNDYLEPFDISAKDIRGFHANSEMQTRLKAVRAKGGKLPEDKKEREKKLKDEFKKALEETAEAVGHEAATLRSQYLVPGLEDEFLKDGKVSESFKKASWKFLATKTPAEKEDDEVESLSKPAPKKKPPRHDLRDERVDEKDPDLSNGGADADRDLSLNYKRVAYLWVLGRSNPAKDKANKKVMDKLRGQIKPPNRPKPPSPPTPPKAPGSKPSKKEEDPEHEPGDVWKSDKGFAAMNPEGAVHTFEEEDAAKAYAQGQNADDESGSNHASMMLKNLGIGPNSQGSIFAEDQFLSNKAIRDSEGNTLSKAEARAALDHLIDTGVLKKNDNGNLIVTDKVKNLSGGEKAPAEGDTPEATDEDLKHPEDKALDEAVKEDQTETKSEDAPAEDTRKQHKEQIEALVQALDDGSSKKIDQAQKSLEALYKKDPELAKQKPALDKAMGEFRQAVKDFALAYGKLEVSTTKKDKDESQAKLDAADKARTDALKKLKGLAEPEAPKAPEAPTEPEAPEEPEAPKEPEAPASPEAPGVPEVPDAPEPTVNRKPLQKAVEGEVARNPDFQAVFDKLDDEEKDRAATEYSDHLKELKSKYKGSDGHTDAVLSGLAEAPQNLAKSPKGQLGKALAEAHFARTVLANPFDFDGQKVSDGNEPRTDEFLAERAKQSLKKFTGLNKELRQEAAQQLAAEMKKAKPGTPYMDELERIADGLQLAALLDGDGNEDMLVDGKPLRPPHSAQYVAMAKALHRGGQADVLLGTKEAFYSPEGRRVIEDAMRKMSDDELLTVMGESADSSMRAALSDPKVPQGSKDVLRKFLQRQALNDMTVSHQVVVSLAMAPKDSEPKKDESKKDKPKSEFAMTREISERISKKARSDDGYLRARKAFEDCVVTGGLDPKSCEEKAKVAELASIQAQLKALEEEFGTLPDNHPQIRQMRYALEKQDPSEMDKKFVSSDDAKAESEKPRAPKPTLHSEDEEEIKHLFRLMPKDKSPEEVFQQFLQRAKPETRERMRGMTPAEFMEILGAIMGDKASPGGATGKTAGYFAPVFNRPSIRRA